MRRYSERFKAKMIEKLTAADPPSATDLATREGIPQTTLSRWLREAGRVGEMSRSTSTPKRLQDWTAEEKLEAVAQAASLSQEELGEFLRRRGLHQAQLEQWREQMLLGLASRPKKSSSAEKRQIRSLERELHRKDKALAEVSALLVLQKKARTLWGDEDDDIPARSGR